MIAERLGQNRPNDFVSEPGRFGCRLRRNVHRRPRKPQPRCSSEVSGERCRETLEDEGPMVTGPGQEH